jgi:hypothetical protein
MKSRRVHRVRAAQRLARNALETYRMSNRGLTRVFASLLKGDESSAGTAAARAAHHLAEVERMLPSVREAIRSCRYPGAEHTDPAALLWGLWGQLSETQLHIRGALQSLEVLGQRYRYRNERAAMAELQSAARPRRAKRDAARKPLRGRSR